MVNFLIVASLLITGFTQKWLLPNGTFGCQNRFCIGDTDKDGNFECIFRPRSYGHHYGYIYELDSCGTWAVDSFIYYGGVEIWEIGDFDRDGFSDMIVVACLSSSPPFIPIVAILESPDSFSYPACEVWQDTVTALATAPILSYDVDRDGLPEILSCKQNETPQGYEVLTIYESIGNNNYIRIFSQIYTNTSLASTMAFGDFDRDSLIEFVVGGTRMYIYESPANNTYEKIYEAQLFPPFITECFSTMDLDRDEKLEFIVKSIHTSAGYVKCFIFEAPSNSTYEIIKDFTFYSISNFEYAGGFSDSGDIDGDSIPEIVLEASDIVAIIKAYRDENGYYDDSFYVWQTLPGNATGSSVRVFDLDRNGLNEIIISGNNQTRIYEKTPQVTWFCPEPYDTFWTQDTVYPKWKLDETISLDSLRLYWSRPQMGCHLIYQGLPTDTICQWVVPDTPSNYSNRLWLVVKGLGRYDSTSSPVFYIKRHTGVEETKISQSAIRNPQLEIYPNPVYDKLTIQYAVPEPSMVNLTIYDVSGRLVEVLVNEPKTSGCYKKKLNFSHLPQGVYFICLNLDNLTMRDKIIIIR